MKCPKCQTDNPEGSQFCGVCGQSFKIEVACAHCGHLNPKDFKFCNKCGQSLTEQTQAPTKPQPASSPLPTSFANNRYQVKKFLGEGGKKKVYLAHDTELDRDVAFALIKTEKLDESARTRIKREAQAMGKLGDHPNIVSIFDIGDHQGQPYIVIPFMPGGDVEGLIKKASDHKLPLDKATDIAKAVCRGLEFAHAKGIIHRDIKPGNIWLNAEGIAQIGDFGLAVAVDLSRLTGVGMMVGTVSYMPPEQAMGGQVTAKADLYSLGAMLYEMVTGRPPFVGDESVAIIGQHINTPPVSPTWHRADLPPSLETLIMQLLEKDPEKRPQSATVVLQALDSIGKGKTEAPPSTDKQTPVENPLYRRVFVGREAELKQLQSAFDGAMSGQGALMMVMGEPGIGKTALCEQLSTWVTLRGGKTMWGHCYEAGSLSLPYLAFVEAMRSYVLDREPEDLKKELGSGATDVARIVSEIREKLNVQPRQAENPEEDRYRLLQAVSSFLTHAAAVKPMLMVLEDLHDADKGTLEMLSYISRNLAGARLLVVGTYRDVEVDRNHPLSAALAELRRSSSFARVLLRGLDADEVSRMLKGITHDDVPWGLAQAIHKQTEGNPLFVQEVVRYLTEQKLLIRAGGKILTTGSTPVEMSIPEGLRDVIGKRLSSLSPGCNRLLSVAAVIGREFRLDVLQKVAGLTEDEVFAAIEEAKRVAIIQERPAVGAVVTYRFAHAFFRTVLYEENIAPRRIRLHQQVARALEEVHAGRLQEHAAELAEHFSYSTESTDLTRAVGYGEMAAQRARDVYDYGEAVRLLQQALKVQEVLDPTDKPKRCDLLTTLGDALRLAGQARHGIDLELPEAFSLAEAIGDGSRMVRASISALQALGSSESVSAQASAEGLRWLERADRYARPDTVERGWADYFMCAVKFARGPSNEGFQHIERAREQALKSGDPDLLAAADALWLPMLSPWYDEQRTLEVAEELVTKATRTYPGLGYAGGAFFAFGKRKRYVELRQEQREMTARTRQVNQLLYEMSRNAAQAYEEGRLEESLQILDKAADYGREVGLPEVASHSITFSGLRTMVYLGNASDYPQSSVWAIIPREMDKPIHRRLPILQAHLGQFDKVNTTLDWMLGRRPNLATPQDMGSAALDVVYLESAVLAGHLQAAGLLLQRFAASSLKVGIMFPSCIGRHLGGAAALLARYEEARQHYQEAIRVCTEMRFRPELALSRLQLAELFLDHYPAEKKDALEHLDFAIKEFREMKMQPSLERALRHKEILKA